MLVALRRAGRRARWWAFILLGVFRPERLRLGRPPPWRVPEAPVAAEPRSSIRVAVSRPVVYGELIPADFSSLPVSVEAPEPAVTLAEDVILIPGHLFVDRRKGTILPQSRDIAYYPPSLSGEGVRPPRLLGRPQEVQAEVFVMDCHFTDTYGHYLLEALPRLMLLDRVPAGIEIVTSIPRSKTVEALIDGLGIDQTRVRYYREPLFCRRAYLPERLVRLNRFIHPLAREAFSRMGRLGVSSSPTPERVFISRARIGRRRLVNEAAIEAIFAGHGFHIVHPELLPIEEQIALFGKAAMIAGLGGSAMHNTVFSPPETKVLLVSSLDWFVKTDVLISQRDGQLGYVFGRTSDNADDAGDRTWRVDPAAVEAAVVAHFGL